jgi:DNA-binding transcriptional LysR family regulator
MLRVDEMRLIAALEGVASFTELGRRLGIPKQTISRRIAEVEERLALRLVERTTRAFRLTEVGRRYVERCGEVTRLADEVAREMAGAAAQVTGTLRVTADPLFGELFLPPIVARFVRAHPKADVDVMATSRFVDLVEEGFDVAFRVGALPDSSLIAHRIAPADMAYVASPAYLRRAGRPRTPEQLATHACIALAPEGTTARWAFLEGDAVRWVPIRPRIRVNALALARSSVLDGLGIANLPRFACARALEKGKLVQLFESRTAAFGAIHLVHPSKRLVPARVQAFVAIALEELGARPELQGKARRSGRPVRGAL